jgi:hypothetical protein
MDEVVVARPPDRNYDVRGQAIFIGAVADPGDDTIHACSSSSNKLMFSSQHRLPQPLGHCAIADAAVGMMQAILAPECLSPSRTLRPVFIQEFFFSARRNWSLCIHLLVKMVSEQHTSPHLRPHPPRPQLPWHKGAIIYTWYSSVSISVTAYASSRRCNYEGMPARQILPPTCSPVSSSVVSSLWLQRMLEYI